MINSSQNKNKILEIFLKNSIFDGWNKNTLLKSAKQAGFDEGDVSLIFYNGIYSLMDFYIQKGNDELEIRAKDIDIHSLKVRDKIKQLVKLRLLIEEDNKNVLKSLTTISKGRRIPYLLKNSYKIADKIWKIAGDTSNDINFYTKRMILSKVFSRTLLFFINDNSNNNEKSWLFLDKQIDKVMIIGKIKMKIKDCANNLKDNNFNLTSIAKEQFNKLPFIRLIKRKK